MANTLSLLVVIDTHLLGDGKIKNKVVFDRLEVFTVHEDVAELHSELQCVKVTSILGDLLRFSKLDVNLN